MSHRSAMPSVRTPVLGSACSPSGRAITTEPRQAGDGIDLYTQLGDVGHVATALVPLGGFGRSGPERRRRPACTGCRYLPRT